MKTLYTSYSIIFTICFKNARGICKYIIAMYNPDLFLSVLLLSYYLRTVYLIKLKAMYYFTMS